MTAIHITYALTFQSPFHMGTGVRSGLLDRTVKRDNDGYLYIPASTFKGTLREQCEQIERFYAQKKHRERVVSPHNAQEALKDFSGEVTMVTRIFGSRLFPGTLHFENAYLSESDRTFLERRRQANPGQSNFKQLQTTELTQVRIDRLTRTAVEGALYTSEFGIPELTFEGEMNGDLDCAPARQLVERGLFASVSEKTPSYSLLLLLASLRMFERLGGNKSTGKGLCECNVSELEIAGQSYTPEQYLSWLEHLDVLDQYPLV